MNKFSLKPYTRPLQRYKNGKFKFRGKTYYKWFTHPHRLVIVEKEGEYQNIKLQTFEATDNQIKIWLKRLYDFEFDSYTEKGNVKVNRDQLKSLGEYGKDLVRLIKVKKDISQLGGTENSLIQTFNPETTAIHGRIDTLGATTNRATHCLPLSYKIKTLEGYKSYNELSESDLVYSYDTDISLPVLVRATAINTYKSQPIVTLSNNEYSFDCTLNHRWLTKEGIKETKDIIPQDTLILKGQT